MLRYSAQNLYGVNAMGMVYPRLKPLPPTLIREIDVQGGIAVRRRDYFNGKDKPLNEYPPLKNGFCESGFTDYYKSSEQTGVGLDHYES